MACAPRCPDSIGPPVQRLAADGLEALLRGSPFDLRLQGLRGWWLGTPAASRRVRPVELPLDILDTTHGAAGGRGWTGGAGRLDESLRTVELLHRWLPSVGPRFEMDPRHTVVVDRWSRAGPTGLRGRLLLPGEDASGFSSITSCAELEPYAQRMAQHVAYRLRYVLDGGYRPRYLREGMPTPGPGFRYSISREMFCGRTGSGPLRIALDTNLLSDYFTHGAKLWTGATAHDLLPPSANILDEKQIKYPLNLEFLQHVVALWTLRDIRLVILPATLRDAKAGPARKLGDAAEKDRDRSIRSHFRVRRNAFHEFAAALSLVESSEPDEGLDPGLLYLPPVLLREALRRLPAGYDALLVEQAVHVRAHVFLTRDEGVLRARPHLMPFGVWLASPQQLWRQLLEHGAFDCLLDPNSAYWPFQDTLRTAHLLHRSTSTPTWPTSGAPPGRIGRRSRRARQRLPLPASAVPEAGRRGGKHRSATTSTPRRPDIRFCRDARLPLSARARAARRP